MPPAATREPAALSALLSEIDELDLKAQALREKASIDILGTATRDFSNKLVLASVAGALVGSVAKIGRTFELAGLKMEIGQPYIIPIGLILIIFYYASCLLILSSADYTKWSAIYGQNMHPVKDTLKRLRSRQAQVVEYYGVRRAQVRADLAAGSDLGPAEADGTPSSVAAEIGEARAAIESIDRTLRPLLRFSSALRRRAAVSMAAFVGVPIVLGLLSTYVLSRSALALILASNAPG